MKPNMMFTIHQEKKTMKKSLIPAFMAIVALTLAGCNGGSFCMRPEGAYVTEEVALEAFTGIDLCIDGDVTLHRDSVQRVTISGYENIVDNVERNVVGGVWEISFDECVRRTGDLQIDIWVPTIDKVILSGSGDIEGLDAFTTSGTLEVSVTGSGEVDLVADADIVRAKITGSGDIDLVTHAQVVEATITGSGDIELEGSADDCHHKITGSGSILAFDMPCTTATVEILGSGNCELTVSDLLDVRISGSGNVYYKGEPTTDVTITGSGSVKHVN